MLSETRLTELEREVERLASDDVAADFYQKDCASEIVPAMLTTITDLRQLISDARELRRMREVKIDEAFVEDVEGQVGHGCGAWDMEDPRDICKAVLHVALKARTDP